MEELGLDFVIMSPEMLIPLPTPKQDYPQATLYIVASHWASDGEYGSYEIPFTSLIDAQRQFHDDLREEQDGGSIDSWRQKSQFVEEETQNSYQELKESICKAATAYTRHVSLGGIRIKQKYGDEATSYANEAVKNSQCLKRISEAAFDRQDMNEIAALAKQLREEILQVLHVFYLQHMCIYVSKECMSDHHLAPEVYNDATAQVWRNGEWQTMEDTSCGALLPVEVIYEVPGPVEAAA